jgi:Arc/MetJ family transcription regulator
MLACEHRFHPDCLRVACRVRGDRETVDADGRRLVGCDVKGCSGEGWVEAADWEEDADKVRRGRL